MMQRRDEAALHPGSTENGARRDVNAYPAMDGAGSTYASMAAIAAAFCIVLFLLPLALTIVTSFRPSTGMGLVGQSWTVENYTHLFRDDYFIRILWTTVLLGLITATIATALAYPLAYFIVHSPSRLVKYILALVVAPMFISSVVRALGWVLVLGEFGPVNVGLVWLGMIQAPLKLTYNFSGVVIAVVHWVFPFVVLILVASIYTVNRDLEEAARDLGARWWETFLRITLPLTLRGVVSAFLLALSATVSGYTTMVLMGGGRVKVASMLIADYFRGILNYPAGAAVSLVLLLTTLLLAGVGSAVFNKGFRR